MNGRVVGVATSGPDGSGRDDNPASDVNEPHHVRQLRRPVIPTFLAIIVSAVSIVVTFLVQADLDEAPSPSTGVPVPGCLSNRTLDVSSDVGKPTLIETDVNLGGCTDFPDTPLEEEPPIDGQFKNEIMVGDTVRLRLVAPLLPVQTEPISSEVQRIAPENPRAEWTWQVVAEEPGEHRLSIVASVLDSEGKEVLIENPRVEIRLHASGTFSYYIGRFWAGATSFLVTAQGALVAVITIASAAGAWLFASDGRRSVEMSQMTECLTRTVIDQVTYSWSFSLPPGV